MNIIFGDDIKNVSQNYTVLELDSFRMVGQDHVFTAYCVVETIPLVDFPMLEALVKVHHDLIDAYKNKNWEYCICAIKGLVGKWNGELDSFYEDLARRVVQYQTNAPGPEWSPIIERDDQTID